MVNSLESLPRALFWDVDPVTLDPERHSRFIIERILQFGRPEELQWMISAYAEAAIDALHISIATVAAMDYLLTWNGKPIANAEIQKSVFEICSNEGYTMPTICTPMELMGR